MRLLRHCLPTTHGSVSPVYSCTSIVCRTLTLDLLFLPRRVTVTDYRGNVVYDSLVQPT